MKCWSQLIIDVDYSPADPGINNWFCESSEYSKAELEPGKTLSYKDPGGLFGSITVKDVDDIKVVRYTPALNAISNNLGLNGQHIIFMVARNGYKIKGFPTQRLFNNAFAAVNEAVDGLIRIE